MTMSDHVGLDSEWQRKGATLSDKTARKEFGLAEAAQLLEHLAVEGALGGAGARTAPVDPKAVALGDDDPPERQHDEGAVQDGAAPAFVTDDVGPGPAQGRTAGRS